MSPPRRQKNMRVRCSISTTVPSFLSEPLKQNIDIKTPLSQKLQFAVKDFVYKAYFANPNSVHPKRYAYYCVENRTISYLLVNVLQKDRKLLSACHKYFYAAISTSRDPELSEKGSTQILLTDRVFRISSGKSKE